MPDFGVQAGKSGEQVMAKNILKASKTTDKRNGQFDEIHFITENYVERIWLFQKHKCFYCNKQMQVWDRCSKDGCTIERLDNKFGHTIKNCVLACCSCNSSISGGRPKNKKHTKLYIGKQEKHNSYTHMWRRKI